MKAVVLVAKDGLELQDVPVPQLEPDSVLVRIERSAICNTTDTKVKEADDPVGVWPCEAWPIILGHEICGTIEAVGEAVDGWERGDRIAGWGFSGTGGFAEYCLVKADSTACVKVPEGMSAEVGCLMEIAMGTARYLFSDQSQERLSGAGTAYVVGLGPCGLAYVLNLVNMGMTVFASGRHAERLELARQFGAEEVFDAESNPADILAARGIQVDVACDTTGRDFTDDMLKVVKPGGVIVPFGGGWNAYEHAPRFAAHDIILAVGGVAEARLAGVSVLEWFRQGKLPIGKMITHRIALEELAEGFELIRQRKAIKVVAEVS